MKLGTLEKVYRFTQADAGIWMTYRGFVQIMRLISNIKIDLASERQEPGSVSRLVQTWLPPA